MRHLFLRSLHYARSNKIKTTVAVGTVTLAISGPLFVYNAKINPVLIGTAIVRSSRTLWSVSKSAILFKIQSSGWDKSTKEYEKFISQVHAEIGEATCSLCKQNGGLYIKIGQHIASLDYLLPKEYVRAFKVLHSEAPQSSLESVRKVVKSELGQDLEELFSEFDDEPLGSASLAQVHRAVLRQSGAEVAVKVQHSTVREHSKIDTVTIEFVAKALDKIFPDFEFDWLIETIKRNLPKELDFVQEGQNAEHLSMLFEDTAFLKVPKIHWDYTNKRVLVMEYCRGGKVDDVKYMKQHKIDENVVLSYLSKIFSQMIFIRGYIHCDPHPGNVLVQKVNNRTQIVLLDHGLYQTITDDFRITYCKLWQALLNGDTDKIKKQSVKLGVGKHYGLFACMVASRTWDDITQVGMVDNNYQIDVNRLQAHAVNQIPQISQVLNYVPRQLLLILKTNDLLRGIETTLLERNTQGVGTFLNMARYCMSALATHKLNKSDSLLKSLRIYYNYWTCLLRLKIYKLLYWISLTSIGQRCATMLPSSLSI